MSRSDTTPWKAAPMIFIVAPACPSCGCEKYDRHRTEKGGDGSRCKKATCRACGQRFLIVIETLPDSGNCD